MLEKLVLVEHMCGICGVIVKAGSDGRRAQKLVLSLLNELKHRGPDASGVFPQEDECGMAIGHQRLSIIDRSEQGRQPILNEDGTYAIAVNGEIYNYQELARDLILKGHRFRSKSDSEVVLHLFEEYGESAFTRLRGMYAVAVLQLPERRITLARDPLGIKPLYVAEASDYIAFASEIRALKQISAVKQPDIEGIASFLLLGCIPAPLTHLKGIRALRPGEVLTIADGRIRSSGGVAPGTYAIRALDQSPCGLTEVRECLHDSVRRHLVSDVPIGLFLSGGIDSGALAGMARETTDAEVHAICVTVPGHMLDESRFARMTANAFGITLTEVPYSQQDFESDIDGFFQHIDMPTVDGFNSYIVSGAARKAGLTVALSGTGGDEVFGGYPTFTWTPFFRRVLAMASVVGAPSRWLASSILRVVSKTSGASRVAELLRHPPSRSIAFLGFRGLFVGATLESMFRREFKTAASAAFDRYLESTQWCAEPRISSDLSVAGLEIEQYMQPMLLRDIDVFSMAHSLEVRTPLVDLEVLRVCLPHMNSDRLRGDGHPKWLLRQALWNPLPAAVVQRAKQAFVLPWQEWMKGRMLSEVDGLLQKDHPARAYLDFTSIRRQRDDYVSGRSHWRCLWACYVLLRLWDGYNDSA